MGGPRVTTGVDSKQDYGTPDLLLDACEARFGGLTLDLAAHCGNTVHDRYLAPKELSLKYDPQKDDWQEVLQVLHAQGGDMEEIRKAIADIRSDGRKGLVTVPNHDTGPVAFDSFSVDWWALQVALGGIFWLNPPFTQIPVWAAKCKEAAALGCQVLFLVPAAVGSNWFRDHVVGHAAVYYLNGRVSFNGLAPYPKDCMVCHYGAQHKRSYVWDWKRGRICHTWYDQGELIGPQADVCAVSPIA